MAAWTQERLVSGVRRFIAEDLAEKDLLTSAERPAAPGRLLAMAGIAHSDKATLQAIAARLEAISEPTPRGECNGSPAGARVIERAKRLGMSTADPPS